MGGIHKFTDRILERPAVFEILRRGIDARKNILNVIKEDLDVDENDRILDIGCGSGYFSKVAKGSYVGIDMSAPYIEFATKHYADDKKSFMIMDAKDIKFNGDYFDKSLFLSMLHHFSDEENAAVLKEAARVTKKYLFVMDLLPTKKILANILYKIDRGSNIRPKEEQFKQIAKYFSIIKYREFGNMFFECSLLLCRPIK